MMAGRRTVHQTADAAGVTGADGRKPDRAIAADAGQIPTWAITKTANCFLVSRTRTRDFLLRQETALSLRDMFR